VQYEEEQLKPAEERIILHCAVTETDDGLTRLLLIVADHDMLQRARELAHQQPLFMDTTFAIVRYKLSFLTLLALDEEGRGEPVCWAFLPDEQETTITEVLRIWRGAVVVGMPHWEPSCFLTDDCDAEQNAVECVPVPCLRIAGVYVHCAAGTLCSCHKVGCCIVQLPHICNGALLALG